MRKRALACVRCYTFLDLLNEICGQDRTRVGGPAPLLSRRGIAALTCYLGGLDSLLACDELHTNRITPSLISLGLRSLMPALFQSKRHMN